MNIELSANLQPYSDEDGDTPFLNQSRRERILLILAVLFVALNQGLFILVAGRSPLDFWHFGVWLACVVIGHLSLSRRTPNRDPFVFPVVMLLSGWGLVLIARLAPPFADRQTFWLALSVVVMLSLMQFPKHLRWLHRYPYLWLTGGLALLVGTIILGRNPAGYGPRLWLGIFDAYFQPSELLKVLLIVFLASYLADNRDLIDEGLNIGRLRLPSVRYLGPLLAMWGISAVTLVWQRDLGTATLFFVIFLGMLYLATGRLLYVVTGALMLLAAGAAAYFVFDVVRLRVDIWLNPWPEANDRAFQIVQSLLAFAAGGILGQGVGLGSPTYIPVVHSDFVFAAIGEEWGLIGTLAVVCCAALFSLRALRLAAITEARPFRSLLAAGIGITFAIQSLLIMGGTVKLIPLTGVTLPFLSYGGALLLVNFVMVGLLLLLSDGAANRVAQ